MMSRLIAFGYGAVSYLLFLATFLYAIGFIGNFGVPKTLDSAPVNDWATSLAIDTALLGIFAVQHSVMARPWFKRMLTAVISPAVERSTYVLASSAALLLLFWQWRPLGGMIWNVENEAGRVMLYGGYAFGLLLVLVSTFAINHFDLFGLRQVWRHMMGQPQSKLKFVTPVLYQVVRHPLYVGWFFTFWSTPVMTVTHLFFAMATTAYILIAIRFEEHDLMNEHPEYAAYRQRVPMFLPSLARSEQAGEAMKRAGAAT